MNGWEWKIAHPNSILLGSDESGGIRYFHAYGPDCITACTPGVGLVMTYEEVNEGSPLCPDCMKIVKAGPPEVDNG